MGVRLNKEIQMNNMISEILGEAIQELKRVPSGHLYARVMGHINIDQYNEAISILKDRGLVQEKSFELIWVG